MDYNKGHMAKASGLSLPISTKKAVEICSALRHRDIAEAKERLNDVLSGKRALPFTRFNRGLGHRKGIGPGRYPIKAATEVLKILNALEANAQFKGLDTNSLVIVKAVANRAGKSWHYGRKRRRLMKRTHIEFVAEERKGSEEKKAKKKGGGNK